MMPQASANTGPSMPDPAARIAALRQRGTDRIDPVRLRLVEAMARRAEAQAVPVRQQLHARLAVLLDELEQRPNPELGTKAGAESDREPGQTPPALTGLAALLTYISQQAVEDSTQVVPERVAPGPRPATDLKAFSQFRSEWSRLGVEQQFTEVHAQVPDNAGPLNAHRLVVQALVQMRDLSPNYLARFLSYANTLLWLEQAEAARAAALKATGESEKRPAKVPRGGARSG